MRDLAEILRTLVGAELASVSRFAHASVCPRGPHAARARAWLRARTERGWQMAQQVFDWLCAVDDGARWPVGGAAFELPHESDEALVEVLVRADHEVEALYASLLAAAAERDVILDGAVRGQLAERRGLTAELRDLCADGAHRTILGSPAEAAPYVLRDLHRASIAVDQAFDALARAKGADLDATIPPLGTILLHLVRDERFVQHFRAFERQGVHVTPVNYYQPIPDTGALPESTFSRVSALPGIATSAATQLALLDALSPFVAEVDAYPMHATANPAEYYLDNPSFAGLDAYVLHCLIRQLRPRRILEVGSGFSTRIMAHAAKRNGDVQITCIEPFPDQVLAGGMVEGARLMQQPVEQLGLAPFLELCAGDFLFIDSSHVSRVGSDVNYLYLEVLPRLAKGVIVHAHDIFLPREYPRSWVVDANRFWNEQYLLQAFLIGNRDFEILFANTYLECHHAQRLREVFPRAAGVPSGSFWMRKIG